MLPSISTLPCPNCAAPIKLTGLQWCQCVSRRLSVICPACRDCFCGMKLFPMRGAWNEALRELLQKQGGSQSAVPDRPTVLIVDDDEEIRLIAEYSLRQFGYRTLRARDGEQGFRIVERVRPDIVLTDELMPKIDGGQLCGLIKLTQPNIKVIVMSSLYTSSRYRREARQSYQADGYLTKPIDFDQLRGLLEKVSLKAA